MDHLERFEDLISTIQVKGVPEDYLLCKLFKYSLAGEASHWLKQLPPGSLTSWADIKNAFLCNFFDEVHAEDLRSKIATFAQEPTESFRSSWIRFKPYQRDCPHHGFNEICEAVCVRYKYITDSGGGLHFRQAAAIRWRYNRKNHALAMTKEMRCKFVRTQRRGLIERQYGLCLDRDASSSSIQMWPSTWWRRPTDLICRRTLLKTHQKGLFFGLDT
ncbi:hypothetical protein Bca4012_075997 [Brassica carinata]